MQIFELFFQCWLALLKEHAQMQDLTTSIDQINRHYQSKSEALEMRQAAMITEHEQRLIEIKRERQQKMAQLRGEREGLLAALAAPSKPNDDELPRIKQK